MSIQGWFETGAGFIGWLDRRTSSPEPDPAVVVEDDDEDEGRLTWRQW